MNIQTELTSLRQKNLTQPRPEYALDCCRVAKQLERAGSYELAAEVLAEFWPNRESLQVDGLDDFARAQVLLRVGSLAGWLGSVNQEGGSQENAKDLITRSIDLFEKLNQPVLVAEARGDLGLCYWREGSYDEARVTLAAALDVLDDSDVDVRATTLIRAGIVEVARQRVNEALRFYDEATVLLEPTDNHALKGSLHLAYGLLFRKLAAPENREDYLDRALVEYTAACFHYEQIGNTRALARVENNLGFLFFTIGQYADAHMHLDRARTLYYELNHRGNAASADETRARTFLAQGKLADAERLVRAAIRVLERGDEQAVLAEALTTYGIVKARLGKFVRARQLLDRAIDVAETCGDVEGSGRAKLSIIEELTAQTSAPELADIYHAATDLLKGAQDPMTKMRLIKCALIVIDALRLPEGETETAVAQNWESFSIKKQVRAFEKSLIERALRDSGGAVTKAAHMLGFKHHQSLISLINSRHRDLLGQRSAVRPRRSHLFSKSRKSKRKTPSTSRLPSSQIRILHVEDQKPVADQVGDLLKAENWKVDWCTDVDTALRMLTGDEHYDALVIGNTIGGMSAFELAERARKITHRRRTPMIMMSPNDFEKHAWRAGMDAFLKQPQQMNELASTVNRLLREGSKNR
jgi:tetratricopeptide (TPR) repeat protein